jgi:UDP-N-acetylmuramoyl-L-alanyl-D-glutamate--2,6-diaminopimelate ligase
VSGVASAALADALRAAGVLRGVAGPLPDRVSAITDDSRGVTSGGAFVAVRGSQVDGHAYLAAAVAAGAGLVIAEEGTPTDGPALLVAAGASRRAAAAAGAAFHDHPAERLTLVAVTGTNGKTTTVGMLRHLLADDGGDGAGSIGTLGVLVGAAGAPLAGGAGLTTPGPIELQRVLRALVDVGVRRVAMETSSHALDQRRVDGLRFAAAVFTNFTRDHLDYHGTMDAYFAAKARLIDHLAPDGTAVVSAEDPAWASLPPAPRRVTFGRGGAVHADAVAPGPSGSRFTLVAPGGRAVVTLPLLGEYNVVNALGATAAALTLGDPLRRVAERLSAMPQVPGRLEQILDGPTVLRDYAHTPDALERALAAVRPFTSGRLVVVFGCGGDRDPGKRPVMGRIAERLADVAVVTSDNPRTEDPEAILDQIVSGMSAPPAARIEDRRAAIRWALAHATPGDVVLLAGKGHEDYQIRGTAKTPFDERRVVAEEWAALRGSG